MYYVYGSRMYKSNFKTEYMYVVQIIHR